VDPDRQLLRRVPSLLRRARALLHLPGGPEDRLGDRELGPASRAVLALHEGLVGQRALARPETYDERAHLGAYLLWWWPQSYRKTRAALQLLPQGSISPGRVLDLGAGPGPAALAALDALPGSSAIAVDASGVALDEAVALAADADLSVRHWKLGQGALPLQPSDQFQLIVAAHVLSELPGAAAERAALLNTLSAQHLAPRGVLLLVEPALRETGRALLEVRDALITAGPLRALAPCLTQRMCPALEHGKDWCTAEVAWSPPTHVKQLADATGLRADEMVSIAPAALAHHEAPRPEGVSRVVGVAPPEKGKQRVFVCDDAHGRTAVSRLDRDQSGSNAPLEELHRGDLVYLRGFTQKGDGLRLSKESAVEKRGR
jgi:SAM-dependent methyltransferase